MKQGKSMHARQVIYVDFVRSSNHSKLVNWRVQIKLNEMQWSMHALHIENKSNWLIDG